MSTSEYVDINYRSFMYLFSHLLDVTNKETHTILITSIN